MPVFSNIWCFAKWIVLIVLTIISTYIVTIVMFPIGGLTFTIGAALILILLLRYVIDVVGDLFFSTYWMSKKKVEEVGKTIIPEKMIRNANRC